MDDVRRHDELAKPVGRYRLAAVAMIVGVTLLRLLYLAWDCPLDLAPDEAHYWHWSRHLDWSYYSKGPLIAWLIRASCWLFGPLSVHVTGTEMAAVRLPAVMCGALLLASLYVLTAQTFRRESLALGVVVLAVTLPLVSAGSLLMTIDAPLICCWGWALVFGQRAVLYQKTWTWLAAGLCVALGLLAKHTMVLFVPLFGLFLLCTPGCRHWLLRPGFWIMACVGALGALPILLWNMQHDWVTLRHTGSHAGLGETGGVHWYGPLFLLAGQFGVLLGYWFVGWIWAALAYRPRVEQRPHVRFLWFLSVPVILFFAMFSLKNGGGEPNWPVVGYLAGFVLTAALIRDKWYAPHPGMRLATRLCLPGFAILGAVSSLLIQFPQWTAPIVAQFVGPATADDPLPLRRWVPSNRLHGWRHLAAEVDRLAQELRAQGEEPVLAASHWSLPGEISFYGAGQPPVYSLGLALGDRHSQYDLWRPNPLADASFFAGRTFLVVGSYEECLRPAFTQVEPGRSVVHYVAGQPFAAWTVFVCRGYQGFPQVSGARGY